MRKGSLFLLLFLAAVSSQAQFNLGVKGGVNVSKIYTDAGSFKANYMQSLETKTGYTFGVWARMGKKLYLQPEVLFATKGGSVDVVPTSGGAPFTVDMKTNNLDIPILIGYKIGERIRLMAGPVASITLNEDSKFLDELKRVSGDPNAAFEKSTYGYQAGIGIKLLKLDIDLRKDGSLSEISSAQFGNNDNKFNQRLSGWQLTVGFKII